MDNYDPLVQGWIVASLLDFIRLSPETKDKERVKRLLKIYLERAEGWWN